MPYAMQPIEDVKEYFGEKIALYFALIGQVHSMPSLPRSLASFPPFLQPSLPGRRLPARPA